MMRDDAMRLCPKTPHIPMYTQIMVKKKALNERLYCYISSVNQVSPITTKQLGNSFLASVSG